MLVIILTIIAGIVVSYLLTLEASLATIHIGTATFSEIPMFFVVFVAILIGMLLSSVTTIKNLIESKLTIFGQRRDLKKSYKTTDELLLKIDKLEEEKLLLKEQIKELAHPNKKPEANE